MSRPLPLDAAVLKILRNNAAHPSEISEYLALPVTEVLSSLERLRDAGFEIPQNPTLGLHLVSSPDRLLGDDILSRMETGWLPEVTVFEATASTNDLAVRRGIQGAAAPLVILAETQTSGRGRFGRKWISAPREGIWMSLLLRPEIPLLHWPRLTSTAALAVANAIQDTTQLRAGIKWPNDVLVRGKKICGLLVETGTHPEHGQFAVLGIGINANQTEFPEEIREKASSLRLQTGTPIDRGALTASILDHLGHLLPELESGFGAIMARIEERSTVIGQALRLHTGSTFIEGVAEALDEEGHLLLRMSDGTLQRFSAGEVTTGTQ